jgi:hypothetical protein
MVEPASQLGRPPSKQKSVAAAVTVGCAGSAGGLGVVDEDDPFDIRAGLNAV